MLWNARCLIAWTFRILGCVTAFAWLVGLIYWAVMDMEGFNAFHKDAINAIESALAIFGVFFVFEFLGRLLSWTSPFSELPRFGDKVYQAGGGTGPF